MRKLTKIIAVILLITVFGVHLEFVTVFATQSRYYNFDTSGLEISSNPGQDMADIAYAQYKKTGTQLKYTEGWCADFVCDCAILTKQEKAIPFYGAPEGLFTRIINAGGVVVTNTPKVGDIVFINWNREASLEHVEIIYKVSGSTIYTIGGNTGGNDVDVHTFVFDNDTRVRKVVRPNYKVYCTSHNYSNGYCTICNLPSPVITNYLNQCTQKIDTKIRVKTTKAGTFKTLPCSSNTNSASVDVVSFSAGESFTVTKIIKNTEGNYWYAVNIDGYDRYVYSTYTQFGYSFGVSVENKVYPVSINQGSSFNIDADFTSDNFIYTVKAEVYSGSVVTSGTPVISSSVASIAEHSFNVKGSNVNKNLSFGKLTVGKYTYVLKYNYYYYYCEDNKLKITYTEMTPIITKSFEVVSSSHTHSWSKTVIDSTCTESGYTLYECTCGTAYENDWSTSYGHNPGSAATCTVPQKCSRCGVTLKEATGHTYASVITSPTCTAKGYTTYTCVCGDSYKCDFTAESGHSYNKTVTAPTCASTGYTHYDCSRCSKEYYADYTDMVGHEWDSGKIVKEPTVDEKGVMSFSCKTCKLTKKEDIEKLDFVIGDVDNDGKVSAADARLALRCSVGLEKYGESSKQFSACDADSDGKVTASDARKILRFSVGLEKIL